MHALIVVAHHNPDSLTHAVARRIALGIEAGTHRHTFELADLASEGFDPRFNLADQALFQGQASPSTEIAMEQARLDRADALVLVYPIYWWSFPALLKGWVDRVFTNGWAYEENGNGKVIKKLRRLQVHLVAVGGAGEGTFNRHGYASAMKTQIDHGIFDYCGAQVRSSSFLLASDVGYPESALEKADQIGASVFMEVQERKLAR